LPEIVELTILTAIAVAGRLQIDGVVVHVQPAAARHVGGRHVKGAFSEISERSIRSDSGDPSNAPPW
jgi:hypothetical protein